MTREPRANHGYLDRLVETPSRLPGPMLIWLAALYLGPLSECNERVKVTMGRILEAVDSNELAKAERLESSLTGLLALREVVSRLATWPWSPGVLRSFGAATILPIVLWLVIRTLERFV